MVYEPLFVLLLWSQLSSVLEDYLEQPSMPNQALCFFCKVSQMPKIFTIWSFPKKSPPDP